MRLPLVKLFATAFPGNRAKLYIVGSKMKLVRAAQILAQLEMDPIENCYFVAAAGDATKPPSISLKMLTGYGSEQILVWTGSNIDVRRIRFNIPDEIHLKMSEHIVLAEKEWISVMVDIVDYHVSIVAETDVEIPSFPSLVTTMGTAFHDLATVYVYRFDGTVEP